MYADKTLETSLQATAIPSHAELAMRAAKKLRRARRQSQKEKMGHVVCHHLLCLLNEDSAPTARELRLTQTRNARPPARDDRQISLSF